MIITLKGADFSSSNIGTLSTWSISRVLGSGATYSGSTYVDKNAALSATVTIADGYELGSAGVTVTMGGVTQSDAYSQSDNVITISIASVTGNVVIKVPTVNTSTGEEDSGENTTTSQLVSETGATLLENYAMSTTSSTPTSNTSYYTYQFIPVIAGTTYRIEYARRVWELDSNKAEISTFAAHNDVEDYTFTVGNTTAYISVTVKTTEIAPANLQIETIG